MHTYTISENTLISPTTLLVTLKKEPRDSRPFLFLPGQYAAISFMHHKRPTPVRCFSVVSSPTDPNTLQFSMRVKGRYTTTMKKTAPGIKVRVRGPFGGFTIDPSRDKDIVMLAGGIGITPFISMIRTATITHSSTPITLFYSCASQDDIPFLDELISLENTNPNFNVVFVISKPPTDKVPHKTVETGRITPEIIDKTAYGTYSSKTFFICGPPPFMKGMTQILKDKGASDSRVITEAFSQGKGPQTGKIRSWPLNMYSLSAIGVVLGSFIVMLSDLIKTLPPSSVFNSSSVTRVESLKNNRQTDLDSLVNALQPVASSAPPTNAVTKAVEESKNPSSTNTSSSQNSASTKPSTTPSSTTPTPSPTPTPTPTPTPAPTPTPTPAPKCTTTQSGVTTCV